MSAASAHDTNAGNLFVREMRPTGVPRGAFLFLHGMESHSGWFLEFASRLVGRGWATVTFDRSGWGKSRGVRGHLATYRDFVEEATGVASTVREKYGSLHLVGMSWGGMATLYLGLRRGWLFDSLSLLAPGIASKKDMAFGDKFRVMSDFLRGAPNRRIKPTLHPEHFTQDKSWQLFIDADADRVREITTSFCIETVKMRRFIQETAGKRRIPPALCLLAANDQVIDNRRTEEICRRAGMEVETVPDACHTLIFERPDLVAERIASHAEKSGDKRPPSGTAWVVGGGAVGGTIASLLAFGGATTGVLVKPGHLAALEKQGILLRSGNARRKTGRLLGIAATPEELPADPDLLVVAVKGFDTQSVLTGLKRKIPARTVIASLQNGVDNEAALASALPNNTIVAGAICAGLELIAPGEIFWPDERGGIAGSLYRGDGDLAIEAWQKCTPATGLECLWLDGLNASQRLKWSKLMLNIGFNALNSVTGLGSAQLLSNSKYGCLAVRALREGFQAMRRQSFEPVDLPGFPVSKLRWLVQLPPDWARRIMAWQAARSQEAAFSMRQDILKKRQHTEINELNGKIIQISQQLGMTAAANAEIIGMLENFLKSS